ncbi:MAG: hypothetical protein QF805_19300, partial [Pirellulaceae bacterium]|nr:hypothetical protein [Pirellulaceae bacterium]
MSKRSLSVFALFPLLGICVSLLAQDPALKLVHFQDDGSLLKSFANEERAFLNKIETQKKIQQSIIEAEVEEGLNQARQQMSTNAEGAARELKLLLEGVERTPELDPEVRSQLRDRIETAVQQAQRREVTEADRRAFQEEAAAAAEEARRLVAQLARNRLKVQQLMARFNSLMDEERYIQAQTDVAEQVDQLEPDSVIGRSAAWASKFTRHIKGMKRVQELRHRNFADSLFQNEVGLVPFVDEPPILYPTAEVWEDLSRKRAKYKSMDLTGDNERERRIFTALDEDTTLEFIEQPLNEVIDYLADLHRIPIVIDTKALDDVGIGTDTPVTRNLRGISLRSALRLMLKELELTYIIRDEVLQITTPEEAELQLVTKVYPVGDLVLPIQTGGSPLGFGGGMM